MLRGRHGVALLAGALVLALAGCATPAPAVTAIASSSVSSQSREPVITSSTKAIDAARDLYVRYLQVVNSIGEAPQQGASRLQPLLAPQQYKLELLDIQRLRSEGLHYRGVIRLRSMQSQAVDLSKDRLAAYVCLDESSNRVVDSSGKDVTPANRPAQGTLLVEFIDLSTNPMILSSETWSGASIC